jgi:hypothetical protein
LYFTQFAPGTLGIFLFTPPPRICDGHATRLGSYVRWVLWCATGPDIKNTWSFTAMLEYAFMTF